MTSLSSYSERFRAECQAECEDTTGFRSADIDLNRRRHECCRACAVLVHVLREVPIAHIHLAGAGRDSST